MINEIVNGLIEQYETSNPFELCQCLEIKVFFEDLGKKINGYFQRTADSFEIIHINSNLDFYMQRYICAHELGHAILQPDISISFFIEHPLMIKSKYEIQADKFAAELLISNNVNLCDIENMNIEQLSSYFKVPEKLLRLKFNF